MPTSPLELCIMLVFQIGLIAVWSMIPHCFPRSPSTAEVCAYEAKDCRLKWLGKTGWWGWVVTVVLHLTIFWLTRGQARLWLSEHFFKYPQCKVGWHRVRLRGWRGLQLVDICKILVSDCRDWRLFFHLVAAKTQFRLLRMTFAGLTLTNSSMIPSLISSSSAIATPHVF